MMSFDERAKLKATIKEQLAKVDKFSIRFFAPSQISGFTNVKSGAMRHFVRKAGTNYFTVGTKGNSLVTAATVTSIIAASEGELILPEDAVKKEKKLPPSGPTAQ